MATGNNGDLIGITLDVYLYVVKKGKPVGPRDLMKGLNLSSPSVAYRHLEKLEDLHYLQKNDYGEYFAKNKAHIQGYAWIGRRLIPKSWSYSFLFLGILLVEIYVLVVHFPYETFEFRIFFVLLMLITGLALSVFTVEGLIQNRRKLGKVSKKTNQDT